MKNSKSEVVVKVNTPCDLFTAEQFSLRELSGRKEPFLSVTDEHCISKSVRYTVFGEDLERVYETGGVKHFYLPPQKCFILVEQGTVGFEVEKKLFSCKTQMQADELIVDIIEAPEKLSEFAELIEEKFASLRERFYEASLNVIIDQLNITEYWDEPSIQNVLSDVESTKFLDVKKESDTEFRRIDDMLDSHRFDKSNVKAGRPSGFFTPLVKDEKPWEQDLLLIEKRHEKDAFTVEKPIERMHDIEGKFWLKTNVLYRYPQDKLRLAKELPKLYEQVAKTNEEWREFEQLTEEPKTQKLGDLEIMLPCTFMKCDKWWMDKGVFHFTISNNYCLTPEVSAERSKIMCVDHAISVVSHRDKEYFVVFKSKGNKRFGKNVFAHYVFHKLIPVSDAVKETDKRVAENLPKILFLAYLIQTHRNKLKPHVITEEIFNKFDLSGDLSKEEKTTCTLKEIFDCA